MRICQVWNHSSQSETKGKFSKILRMVWIPPKSGMDINAQPANRMFGIHTSQNWYGYQRLQTVFKKGMDTLEIGMDTNAHPANRQIGIHTSRNWYGYQRLRK